LFDNSNNLFLIYDAVVMGQVFNEQNSEIPEDAVIYVQLNDVSLADAESMPIVEQVITGVTRFSFPFMVNYNPREIVENHTYAIGVRIEDKEGNLLFINPAATNVITNGNPSQVDLVAEAVR
jgi:putative lipoprotein